jgi:rRNA-processing protein FCF1
MMPAQFHVDLFGGLTELFGAYEPLVPARVVQELRGLSQEKGRTGAAARYALALCERCTIVETKGSGTVDQDMIRYASENRCLVLTNDRKVRERLFTENVTVISLRNQKRLEIMRR